MIKIEHFGKLMDKIGFVRELVLDVCEHVTPSNASNFKQKGAVLSSP